MSFPHKQHRTLVILENIIFAGGFAYIFYNLLTTYGVTFYNSVKGEGYLGAIIGPLRTHQYCDALISLILTLNAIFVIVEIFSVLAAELKKSIRRNNGGKYDLKVAFKQVSIHYKSSFLAMLVSDFLPKLILVRMFWVWMPHFQKLQFFTVNLEWYSWIYGYICYELSSWLFHFTSHRIRLLWCLHSPHHAPSEMNMTVNWVHFFAESYYSAFVRLLILMLLGVNPLMFGVMVAIDSAWGIFIHVSENSIRDGRLGILHHLFITPAHHRAHHAKDHLYLDTNFANVLPLWDWIFGTLQPLRKEVKANYGLLRELDVTNFSDLYFGELFLLYRDVKGACGVKNKFLYLFKPPGWTPASAAKTAPVLRREFLKDNPTLGITSKRRLFALAGLGANNEEISADSVNDEATSPSYSAETILTDPSKQ